MRILIIFILTQVICFAQVDDSLLYQLKQIPNDTERINQIYKSGFELRNRNPELAYQYALVCEQEAQKTDSKKHLAKSYNLLGVLYYKKANYTKAIQYQKKALTLNQVIQNQTGVAINQTNLGNIYTDINYFELAEAHYLLALQAYHKTNNTLQLTRCLINIGVLKYNQKYLNAAFSQFNQALEYAIQLNDYDLMATCYNNMGGILREKKQLR